MSTFRARVWERRGLVRGFEKEIEWDMWDGRLKGREGRRKEV